jgi:putative endonuclease
MTEARLTLGAWGEDYAAGYLRKQGMKILHRNLRTPVGEIDIVARHRKLLVFVEVKTRQSQRFGHPQEAVGARKQRQIIRTAQWYLSEHPAGKLQPRFDVVAVLKTDDQIQVEHITNAFELQSTL